MLLQADRPSVIVAGATGLVGRELVRRLVADRNTGTVHAIVRRDVGDWPSSDRLLSHRVDYAADLTLPLAFECYVALGTTIRDAGSREAFRAVDLDMVVKVSAAARTAGVTRLALVSALGADPASSVFYNRVKGEAENAVAALDFERLVIARPSLLVGDRTRIGQRARMGETLARTATRTILPLIPPRLRPIDAAFVARAIVRALRGPGPRVQALESADLLAMGAPSSRRDEAPQLDA